ncbi:hypothetical protein GCM10027451_49870 [Geodermatophilus aquaeductus]
MRTRVETPGQNGSHERGFHSLKCERLIPRQIPDALDVVAHAEGDRIEYDTERPPEALAWNRPGDIHLGLADPLAPPSRDRRSARCLTRDENHPAAGVHILRAETKSSGPPVTRR